MTIRIDNLENLNSVADNLRDMSDAEAAQISGGASAGTSGFTSVFYSDGTGRTRQTGRTSSGVVTDITTIFNADGTTEISGGSTSPAVLSPMRRG